VDLKNPVYRQLLRFVVASQIEDMRRAWQEIIKKFGLKYDKAMDVGKFIMQNKDKPPYEAIGHEEVTRDIAIEVAKRLSESSGDYNTTLKDLNTILSIKPLPRSLQVELLDNYLFNQASWNINTFHNFLNELYKAKSYSEIVNNPEMQKRLISEPKEYIGPYKKSASLRVVLRYLDTLENK